MASPSEYSQSLQLNGINFRILLRDENAKLNINSLNQKAPKSTEAVVRRLLSGSVSLRDDFGKWSRSGKSGRSGSPATFESREIISWGQVVVLEKVFSENEIDGFWGATDKLTCWGNGKINVRRISDLALLELAQQLTSHKNAAKLMEVRKNSEGLEAQEMKASLKGVRTNGLTGWFTDRSSCFGLWIEVDDGKRTWYNLSIAGDSSEQGTVPISFHW